MPPTVAGTQSTSGGTGGLPTGSSRSYSGSHGVSAYPPAPYQQTAQQHSIPTYPSPPPYHAQDATGYAPQYVPYAYNDAQQQHHFAQQPRYPDPQTSSTTAYASPYPHSPYYQDPSTLNQPAPQPYNPYYAPNVYGKHDESNSTTFAGGYDAEAGTKYDSQMITEDISTAIRHGFVRKVYFILTTQLLYTFGFALIFTLVDAAKNWLIKYWWVAILFSLVGMALVIAMSCCPHLGRQVPTNFILLSLITVCLSWLVAWGGAATNTYSFAIAAGMTAAVCIALTIFAIQIRWDFTGCGTFIFVALVILIIFGIVAAFLYNRVLHIVYAALGAVLFSFILVYDTQQVVGGKHRKYQYSIDDYIFGALTLYIDVINLFMMILSLVGATQN